MSRKGFVPVVILLMFLIVILVEGAYLAKSKGLFIPQNPLISLLVPSLPFLSSDLVPGKKPVAKVAKDKAILEDIMSSKNGKTIVYVTKNFKENKSNVVVNGKDQEAFTNSIIYRIQISDDGQIVAYGVDQTLPDKRNFIYFVNGRQQSEATSVVISPSGGKVGVVHQNKDDKNWVSINGKDEKKYDAIFGLQFSDDGKHYSYVGRYAGRKNVHGATRGTKDLVIYDGKEFDIPAVLNGRVLLSSDGEQIAYPSGTFSGTSFQPSWVINGTEVKKPYLDYLILGKGNSISYMGSDDKTFSLFLNGKEINKFDTKRYEVSTYFDKTAIYNARAVIKVSPDWQKIAYLIIDKLNNKQALFLDNKNISGWQKEINGVIFSPDSQKVAYYVSGNGENYSLMINDYIVKTISSLPFGILDLLSGTLKFTPDSMGLFYSEWPPIHLISLDGKDDKTIGRAILDSIVYSPSGESFAWSSGTNIYINQTKEREQDYFVVTNPIFLNENLVRYFAFDGEVIYQVTSKVN